MTPATTDRGADVRLPAIAAGALTAWDATTTHVALQLPHAVELNPLVGALVGTFGVTVAMVLRFVVGLALVLALVRAAESPRCRFGAVPLWVATGLLAAVGVWNTAMLFTRGPWGPA